MKKRLLKSGVPFFLVAVMILVTILVSAPVTSQAAAKGTTYTVVIQSGSPVVSLVSTNGGAPAPSTGQNESITFKMVVDNSKAKTEKLKTGPASYYPVTVLAKSYKAPTQEFPMPGGGTAVRSSIIAKDAVGKLYISGGDVDVTSVLGSKLTSVIGDGTVDPAGSMIIQIATVSYLTDKATGKALMTMPQTSWYTTGKSYCIVKGSKSRLEGKALPNDDTTKLLTTPLTGKPVNLDAGTGTLVVTTGTLSVKSKSFGMIDNLTGQIWVMKINK